MPVPGNLKKNPHVFCYSADLLPASVKLADYLGCKVSKVYEGKFDPQATTAVIAWLVGHGAKSNTIVGNSEGTFGYKIGDISKWLQKYSYTDLVDTCCYPNMRRRYQLFEDDYYCTDDNQCVEVITSYPDFDSWWDASNMHQYTT